MNEESGPISQHLLMDAKLHLGFLFDKGYEISSVRDFANVPWPAGEVILKHDDLFLKMYEERGELEWTIGSPSKGFINLGRIVFFLSGQRAAIGGFARAEKYAGPLMKYLDEIESRFRDDYSRFENDVTSVQNKYESSVFRSFAWPILLIIYGLLFIVCFNIYDELVLGWLLSELLLNSGYDLSSGLIKVVSFFLAAVTVYVIHLALKKSEQAAKNSVVYTEPRQRPKRNLILLAMILFPVYFLFFALIIGLALSAFSLDTSNDSFYSITTWAVSFVLSLWIAGAIMKSNRRK